MEIRSKQYVSRRQKRGAADRLALLSSGAVLVPGVTPSQQARSGATFLVLLRAGQKALEHGGMDDMTIGDIARSAGTSVGAFYGRFENKEVFFSAIQVASIGEIEANLHAMFETLEADDADVTLILVSIAKFWVMLFRENRGLYRASFKHSSAQPGVWTPFRRLGYTASELIVSHVLPRLLKLGLECNDMQIKAAMQFVNGLLVNSTINDPGPVRLDDPEMEMHIARFLCTFLGVPPASGTLAAKKRTPRKTS